MRALALLLLLAAPAYAADIPALCAQPPLCLFTATFSADDTFVCFTPEGSPDGFCTPAHIPVAADGSWTFAGKVYRGAPAGAQFVAMKAGTAAAGTRLVVKSGNATGSATHPDRLVVPAASTPPPDSPPAEPNAPPTTGGNPSGGADCVALRAAIPGVAYCQDYEGIASLAAWPFSAPFDNCLSTPENPRSGCIANIIAGGFRGRSLAQQFQPGREGGTTGVVKFAPTPLRTVGIAQARMWTGNYVTRDHGVKDNRFGGASGNFEVFGESATGVGSCKGTSTNGNRFPFGAIPDIVPNICQTPPLSSSRPANCVQSAAVGRLCEDDVHYDFIPGAGYDFAADMHPGQWVCLRAQFDGFGLANMRVRYWVGEKLVIDGVVDGTKLRGELANGVDTYEIVAFQNDGYEGSTVAERRDDNVVIVNGAAPSCAAIGF